MGGESMGDDRVGMTGDQDSRRGSIRHFSLMNSLLAVINSENHDSTEALLATYFLENFDCLETLNVYDVADACFTSRSGIRRFCQSIGLDNFSDLKSYSWEWDEHRDLFVSYADHEDYQDCLVESVDRMLQSIRESVSPQLLDDMATLIYEADKIVILTSDFSSAAVRQFQQSMLYLHRIVHVVTDSTGDVQEILALGYSDALLVVSEHGGYASAVRSMLAGTRVPRALVTLDCPEDVESDFDIVVRISAETRRGSRSVFSSYGVTFLLDLVYNRYFELYGK